MSTREATVRSEEPQLERLETAAADVQAPTPAPAPASPPPFVPNRYRSRSFMR